MTIYDQQRAKYADYIAEGLRYAEIDTNIKWPEDTIIIVHKLDWLTCCDKIVGFNVYVMDIDTSTPFTIGFKSGNERHYKLLSSFREYTQLYDMEERC